MAAKIIQTREMYLSVSRYTWVKQITPAEAPDGTEIYFDANSPIALCFTGKSGKASLYCRYSNSAHRAHEVTKWYQAILAAAAEKAAFAKAKAEAVCPFTVGQILYGTWGYEQTNVEFYKIKAVQGKRLTLVKMSENVISDGICHMSGRATPNAETAETITRMARVRTSRRASWFYLIPKILFTVHHGVVGIETNHTSANAGLALRLSRTIIL